MRPQTLSGLFIPACRSRQWPRGQGNYAGRDHRGARTGNTPPSVARRVAELVACRRSHKQAVSEIVAEDIAALASSLAPRLTSVGKRRCRDCDDDERNGILGRPGKRSGKRPLPAVRLIGIGPVPPALRDRRDSHNTARPSSGSRGRHCQVYSYRSQRGTSGWVAHHRRGRDLSLRLNCIQARQTQSTNRPGPRHPRLFW